MKIEHKVIRTDFDGFKGQKSSRLEVIVSINGEQMGTVTIMSGPREEVLAFEAGEMTMEQVRAAWGFNKFYFPQWK